MSAQDELRDGEMDESTDDAWPYKLNPSRTLARTGQFWFVDLRGPDGNAYCILGVVASLVKQVLGPEEEARYIAAATSGDYQHLLDVTMEYVELRMFDRGAMFGAVDR